MIDGRAVGRLGITARRLSNAAFVPEERNGHAAVPNFALSDNALLSRHATGGLDRTGFILIRAAKTLAQTIVKAFDVRVGGPDPAARTLSGGNLQKFLVGRGDPARAVRAGHQPADLGASTRPPPPRSTRRSSTSRAGAPPSW